MPEKICPELDQKQNFVLNFFGAALVQQQIYLLQKVQIMEHVMDLLPGHASEILDKLQCQYLSPRMFIPQSFFDQRTVHFGAGWQSVE